MCVCMHWYAYIYLYLYIYIYIYIYIANQSTEVYILHLSSKNERKTKKNLYIKYTYHIWFTRRKTFRYFLFLSFFLASNFWQLGRLLRSVCKEVLVTIKVLTVRMKKIFICQQDIIHQVKTQDHLTGTFGTYAKQS